MQLLQAPIVDRKGLASGYQLLEFEAAPLSVSARPGQFLMIRTSFSLDPLLRRPFSVHAVDGDCVSVLYRTVGRGTSFLSGLTPGSLLDILGPLGRGFHLPPDLKTAYLVAGGRGIAPLLFLAQWIRRTRPETRMVLVYGVKTGVELVRTEVFEALGVVLEAVTEDGSAGRPGLVTDAARDLIREEPGVLMCACGPMPMLNVLGDVARGRGIAAQFSLEAHMGCGLGACRGCVAALPGGYIHVCREGPVVDWNSAGIPEER